MSHKTTQTSVTTTAAVLNAGVLAQHPHREIMVALTNTGATDCFIGGPTVTAANGFLLKAGAQLPGLEIRPGELLYAITASGTTTVGALIGGAQ